MRMRAMVSVVMVGLVALLVAQSVAAPAPTKAQMLQSLQRAGLKTSPPSPTGGGTGPVGPKLPGSPGPIHLPGAIYVPTFVLQALDWNGIICLSLAQPVAAKAWPPPNQEFAALGLGGVMCDCSAALRDQASLVQLSADMPPTGVVGIKAGIGGGGVGVLMSNPPPGKYSVEIWVTAAAFVGKGPKVSGLGTIQASLWQPSGALLGVTPSLDGLNIIGEMQVTGPGVWRMWFGTAEDMLWKVAGVSIVKE